MEQILFFTYNIRIIGLNGIVCHKNYVSLRPQKLFNDNNEENHPVNPRSSSFASVATD